MEQVYFNEDDLCIKGGAVRVGLVVHAGVALLDGDVLLVLMHEGVGARLIT